MNFYVGITDENWFRFLSEHPSNEVNFWRPRSQFQFKALNTGEPFLFKLKKPMDAIAGVAFFLKFWKLPVQSAWDAFGQENGCTDYETFNRSLGRLSHEHPAEVMDREIGCIILGDPIFFSEKDWIAAPPDWPASAMQGKRYSDAEPAGAALWQEVLARIGYEVQPDTVGQRHLDLGETYGGLGIVKTRLGQGLFRILTLENYKGACCITGEKTTPAVEAAHILPVASGGEHRLDNGLALRADFHKLFDRGLLAIDPEYRVRVSSRIRDQYDNGVVYYARRGARAQVATGAFSGTAEPGVSLATFSRPVHRVVRRIFQNCVTFVYYLPYI